MRRLQAASWGKPLAAGVSFTFNPREPLPAVLRIHASRSALQSHARSTPDASSSLRGGSGFHSFQASASWPQLRNSSLAGDGPWSSVRGCGTQFIAPSFLRLPYESLRVIDVEAGDYWYPADVVHRQVAAYLALDDFQGSTLPYFCGMHEAVMPRGEQASVLALEYLPGPNLRVAKDTVDSYSSSSKYQDFEAYLALVNSAISTVRAAHSRDVRHRDLREENMLVDESNDLAVIIDWHNNPRTIDDPGFIAGMDLFKLASTFLRCDRHRKQLREYYRTAHPDIHMSTRFARF
ncbi:hypothetical protein BD626DRAFT_405621 [Schizophyllum amplum]|uniref:Protein kinase domain-containing protein n=1 Tax=Schizophyllum amplum TaxID=97359 RepID=A0A550C9Q3_9AGAR|nr:hypothetical protein BD626DRAFT_405621 [Auriculariopsis ampla]